jgi:tRNA pseudouridine55 synthase
MRINIITTALKDPITLSHLHNIKVEGAVFLIDKPLGWTSFQVVNSLRFRFKKLLRDKKVKVGHAGTLDPLATGLLIVCVGRMTKEIDSFMGLSKTYEGTLKMGETTPSYDGETEVNAHFPIEHITPSVVEAARLQFLGDIQQLPPQFSAIKKEGKPLYESARKGLEVAVEPRRVHIYSLDIQLFKNNEYSFTVQCSKGTYIRSLAYDFGKACGSGAFLTSLKRTAIGDFSIKNAWDLKVLSEKLDNLIDTMESRQ